MRPLIPILIFLISFTTTLSAQNEQIVEERYDSLRLKAIYTVVTDSAGNVIRHGPFIKWTEEGTREAEGVYERDMMDDTITLYNHDMIRDVDYVMQEGDTLMKIEYDERGLYPVPVPDSLNVLTRVQNVVLPNEKKVVKEGYDRTDRIFINHGPATVWYYEDGPLMEKGNFKMGKPHGLMTRWSPYGHKEFEGRFEDGKREGLWVYFNETGAIDSILYFEDDKKIDKKILTKGREQK